MSKLGNILHNYRWLFVVLILAALQASACKPKAETPIKSKPATVERLQGLNLSRVILSARAAERLDIQTTPLRYEQVGRKRMMGGEVVALPTAKVADGNRAWIRVPLSGGDLRKAARGHPARVVPLTRDVDDDDDDDDKGKVGVTAQSVEREDDKTAALYYVIDSTDHRLVPGQRVRVELPRSLRMKVVPHAAVLYDSQGNAWVYTNPEPLVFVRHRVTVEHINGDLAELSDGPPSGTAVVTVGAAELFGTEFEIGK